MKSKIFAVLMLAITAIIITSCASQKYGCPANPQYSSRYKGK
jgi:hypothetical protein